MKENYAQTLTAERRLVLLRILHELPQYTANSSTLTTLLEHWAHRPSRVEVKADLRWLEDRGLVKLEEIAGGDVLIVKLEARGEEVATGRITIEGVKRPGA